MAESQNLFLDKGKSIYSLFEEIIPEKQKDKLKDKGECDFAYETSSGQRFRINLYQSTDGFNAAIRIIPKTAPTCDALDLPEAIRNFSKLQNGLVLITGVTGSGKSTTLASVLNEINQTRAVHIITLEDPVEYKFVSAKSLIHQREVGSDTQSFASGLKSALREDPDCNRRWRTSRPGNNCYCRNGSGNRSSCICYPSYPKCGGNGEPYDRCVSGTAAKADTCPACR